MSIISPTSPHKIADTIEAEAGSVLRSLKEGRSAATGEGSTHMLTNLNNTLARVDDQWTALGLAALDPDTGRPVLTDVGAKVEAELARREGRADYALLANFLPIQQAGQKLRAAVHAYLGDEPAMFIYDEANRKYGWKKHNAPDLVAEIDAMIALMPSEA